MPESDIMPCQKCGKQNALTAFEYMNAIPCEECLLESEAEFALEQSFPNENTMAFAQPKDK